ncbi:MAG TPA: response regulator [Leptolyngbya sp.]|jgi:DNA-binding response OmpR family regulator/HPt (histidine-containing phosphotransfer) domain-containing protein|nr:response regulator [Leptolyngbya sp.]
MKILIVEDDDCIAKTLEMVLTRENYAIDIATSGEAGWRYVETFAYDLILLDIVLPQLDGIALCQRLRSHHYATPVLLITAQESSPDRISGLDAGADDYMTKPFEFAELLARIRVLLRRSQSEVLTQYVWEHLRLDPTSCKVSYRDQLLHLTPKEYRLLELFLRHPRQAFSRGRILEHLWGCEENPGEDTVTAHIKGLRHKLKRAGAPSNLIETVYGLGYRLRQINEAGSTTQNNPQKKPQKFRINASTDKEQDIKTALRKLWKTFRQQNQERIQILHRSITALETGDFQRELQEQAILTAHKLAGTLGVYDLHEGSRLALNIEAWLRSRPALPTAADLQQLSSWVSQLAAELQREPPETEGVDLGSWRYPLIVIDDHADLVDRVIELGRLQNLTIQRVGESGAPDAWILSLPLTDAIEESLTRLQTWTEQVPPISVMVFSDRINLPLRVRLAQINVHAIFAALDATAILALVQWFQRQTDLPTSRILLVDDDPQVLTGMRHLLEPWGVTLTTLEATPQFWDTLVDCTPDLIILDVEMPHFNGFELCQVVRSAPRWSQLPIVLFTMHNNLETLEQAIAAGATRLLDKSIAASEVVQCILNQLERSRLVQSLTALNQ